MTDDLVKRLRDSSIYDSKLLMREAAADRIEELETALREIADGVRDADKSYVSLFHELQFEARAAIKGKKDD
jgi:site-specific recombinase